MYATKISSEAQVSQERSFHMLFQFRVTPLTPLILKVTSQSDEMPGTTVLRAARTSSVNNLKTISEVGNNLTYPGSFVSPSNTYDQRLKKVSFELPPPTSKKTKTKKKKKKKKKKNKTKKQKKNIPGPYKLKVQCRRIPLIWVDCSWAKASHAPCVIYARMHSHFKRKALSQTDTYM